jgi:hypothetical protein
VVTLTDGGILRIDRNRSHDGMRPLMLAVLRRIADLYVSSSRDSVERDAL